MTLTTTFLPFTGMGLANPSKRRLLVLEVKNSGGLAQVGPTDERVNCFTLDIGRRGFPMFPY